MPALKCVEEINVMLGNKPLMEIFWCMLFPVVLFYVIIQHIVTLNFRRP